MSGLATLSLLALSIILHELAHYLSARKSGVAVSEFFIGFGPKIFSLRKGDTEYGVKAILLGGYVKIPEHPYHSNEHKSPQQAHG